MNRKVKSKVGGYSSTTEFVAAHPHLSGPELVQLARSMGQFTLTLQSVYSIRKVLKRASKASTLSDARMAAKAADDAVR